MDWFFIIGVVLLPIGLWTWKDGNRLAEHVVVAEKMMENGLSEPEAMEQSGCNFWDTPWYKRIFKNYPPLPETV